MESIIELVPQFKEKIWGGRKLADEFGYAIPDGPVGECWAISAHPVGDCQVASGAFAGHTLSWLWDEHRELFGNATGDRFPLLVKIIDAADDLSIQVHPDNAYAAAHENGSLGKKECWYVLSAEPGDTIVVGQRAHSRAEFSQLVDEGRWDKLLNEVPVHAGDFFQIDPGTVHAIKGGTVILETQQSSDITYRVYDYDRRQDDGTLRELHLEQALDVIDFDRAPLTTGAVEPTGPVTTLEQNECYTVELVKVGDSAAGDSDGADVLDSDDTVARATDTDPTAAPAAELTVETPYPFTCISVIEGKGSVCGCPVAKGSHLLALAACHRLELAGTMQLIISHL